MSDNVKITIDWGNLYERKRWLEAFVGKAVTKMVNLVTIKTTRHIKEDLFGTFPSGTTRSTLSTRSGKLKKSVTNVPAKREGDIVRGGVGIGTVYGRVHFGKAGQVTEITPKNAKMLAIPLPAAQDSHGVARGAPRDAGIFGQTFIAKSKAGNLIIFGKLQYVKGKKAGQVKGDILPLFALKNSEYAGSLRKPCFSVSVAARIHPEDLQTFVQPLLDAGMAEIKAGLEASSVISD